MRYILLCAIIFSGCTMIAPVEPDTRIALKVSYSEYENYKLPHALFLQVKPYTGKLNNVIKYTNDSARFGCDRWSSPEQTASDLTGDCEDIAILEMVLHYMCYDIKGRIYLLTNGRYDHAVFVNYVYGVPYVYGEGVIMELNVYMKTKNYTSIFCDLNYSQALHVAFNIKEPRFYR